MKKDETSKSSAPLPSEDHASPKQILELAVHHHNLGQFADAEAGYKQVLQLEGNHPIALHLLGVLAHQVGKNEAAIDLIGQAIAVKPDYSDAHLNLGSVLKALGKFNEAISSFHRAIALNPNSAAAHFNLGNSYTALELLEDAVASYQAAIAINPDYGDVYTNLGNALRGLDRLEEAAAAYRKALIFKPNFAEGHYNLGRVLMDQDKLGEAVESYQKALSINPNYVEAYSNLGSAYRELEMADEAIESFEKAIALNPEFFTAYSNLGAVYKDIWQLEKAVSCYQAALSIKPDYAEAHSNLGNAYKRLGDIDQALACYNAALSINPDFIDALQNLGLIQLVTHDFANGWKNQARRWDVKSPLTPLYFNRPLWQGEILKTTNNVETPQNQQRLVVWMEQGVGDEIMFASMINDLKKKVDNIVIECGKRLIPLFERSFTGIDFVERGSVDQGYLSNDEIDYQVPAGNLAQFLRQDITDFAKEPQYLFADNTKQSSIRANYKKRWPGKLLVGISWSSISTIGIDHKGLPLERMHPIFSNPDCQFINLQYGDVEDELAAYKDETGHDIYFDASIDSMLDMDAFAAQVAALDLVISISNTTVHVAGALGVPTWLMLSYAPDWRWMSEGEDSIWYPSLQLYRQSKLNDWEALVAKVSDDLNKYVVNGF